VIPVAGDLGASFSEAERGKASGPGRLLPISAATVHSLAVHRRSRQLRLDLLINPFIALPSLDRACVTSPKPRPMPPRSRRRGCCPGARRAGSLVFGLMASPAGMASARPRRLPRARCADRFHGERAAAARHDAARPVSLRDIQRRQSSDALGSMRRGGAFFFCPTCSQVHGYSPLARRCVLPFTSSWRRVAWAGGLLDRFGARLPSIIGPGLAGSDSASGVARHRRFIRGDISCTDDRAGPRHGGDRRSLRRCDQCRVAPVRRGRPGINTPWPGREPAASHPGATALAAYNSVSTSPRDWGRCHRVAQAITDARGSS